MDCGHIPKSSPLSGIAHTLNKNQVINVGSNEEPSPKSGHAQSQSNPKREDKEMNAAPCFQTKSTCMDLRIGFMLKDDSKKAKDPLESFGSPTKEQTKNKPMESYEKRIGLFIRILTLEKQLMLGQKKTIKARRLSLFPPHSTRLNTLQWRRFLVC